MKYLPKNWNPCLAHGACGVGIEEWTLFKIKENSEIYIAGYTEAKAASIESPSLSVTYAIHRPWLFE